MNLHFSWSELIWYLMIYSFLGWTIEVCIYAVTNHRFVNRGLLNLPFSLPYGLTSVVLEPTPRSFQSPSRCQE